MALGTIVQEARASQEIAYFPTAGMLSVVSVMNNGSIIEVGTVGREGVSGVERLYAGQPPANRVVVQLPGHALVIEISRLRSIAEQRLGLRAVLMRYLNSYLVQATQNVACNGLHNVHQRCCRWLLTVRDRADSDRIELTHEFLGHMLGVRRASVSEVLKPLQDQGLVQNNRGSITILDRRGLEANTCECYRRVFDNFAWLQNPERDR